MIGATRYRLSAEIARQSKLAGEISRAQADISSKTRIQVASDDPAASARVADIRRSQASESAWASNVEVASAIATRADGAMGSVSTALTRARELMVAAGSDTLADSDRAAVATELRGLAQEIDSFSKLTDSRGYALFPEGTPLAIPIGHDLTATATTSKAALFGGVATAGGAKSLIAIINDAATAAETGDATVRKAAAAASLDELEAATAHVAGARAEHGLRATRIDNARERLASSGLVLEEERSGLEDTDITATVAKLQARLVSLEAAQAAFARISQKTLFDVLG